MRSSIPVLFFLLACSPSTTVISGDDQGDDSAADTADTGGDSGTDIGGDSGEDTGQVESDAGDYEGTLTAEMGSEEWSQTCEGGLAFTLDEDGVLEGSADCAFEGGGWGEWAYEGELVGEVVDGELLATWTVDVGWGEPYAMEVTGTVADGAAELELYGDLGRMGEVWGEGWAERQ